MNSRLLQKLDPRAGMTLVEIMVSVAIGSIVLAAVGSLIVFTARSFVALGNYNDLDQASRNALDIMSRDIRQVRALTSYKTNYLRFTDKDNQPLEFVWDPTARTLSRIKNAKTNILLEQCDTLRFNTSQRNPTTNFNFVANATLAEAKLVDVSWTCSRQIFQKKANTESVQTAKIVIRN